MRLGYLVVGVAVATLVRPLPTRADQLKCSAAVLRHGTALFVTNNNVTAQCERGELRMTTAEGCPSLRDSTHLALLDVQVAGAVTAACAGEGSETTTCLFSATSESFDLVGNAFAGNPRPQPDAERRACARALGRETTRAGDLVARKLALCNLAVLRGVPGNGPAGATCDGPGLTQAKIEEAEARLANNVGRACGGSDHTAGTTDDLDPQTDLGLGATCPGSPYCESPIDTLPDLITCAQCIAREEANQVARGFAAIPLDVPTTCQLAIGGGAAALADAYMRDASDCEDRILDGHTTPPCPDAETSADLTHNAAVYDARVAAGCGGPTGPTSSDVTAFTDALIQFLYPTHAEETDNDVKRCRKRIGGVAGAIGDYGRGRLHALTGCDVQSVCGQTTGTCPDSEAAQAIASRANQSQLHIHGDCDDFTPAALGFAATCPAVASCGSLPTTTIAELIACIQCVADAADDGVLAIGF